MARRAIPSPERERFRLLSPAHLRQSFAHAPRTLALVWRASVSSTLLLGLLTIVSAALPITVALLGKRIVDAVVAHAAAVALRWVLAELVAIAAQALVMRTLGFVQQQLGARLALDINVLILEKAGALELRHFEDPEIYDQLTRARREASSRPVSVVVESFQLIQNLLTLAGYAALLVGFSPLAVLGLLAAAIPATLVEMRFSDAAFRMRNWRSPDARKLNYLEYVLANDEHAKEVKLFEIGPLLLRRYREMGERFYREDRGLAARRTLWAFLLSTLGTGAFYACYAVVALAAARGRMTLGTMTLYMVAFRQGQQAFQSILGALGSMYEDNLYMSNLFGFLALSTGRPTAAIPTEALSNQRASGARPPLLRVAEPGIRFEDVGFRYAGQEPFALRAVTLVVPPGQSVALVGPNGAGKTTFIKLLTRLYDPTEGRILLDGRDLRDWDERALRARIGVIFQDFNQYQLPLRENVGVGSVEHLADDLRLERAVEAGGARELVASLPGGLDAPLGRWFREGSELSGGQWQKIALARAFMREEADILVLDEPTAALDAEAEHVVFERFRTLARGRTTFLISHRFSTVRQADRIVVFDGGRIVEAGSHADLVAAGARYARLFALQAAGYQ